MVAGAAPGVVLREPAPTAPGVVRREPAPPAQEDAPTEALTDGRGAGVELPADAAEWPAFVARLKLTGIVGQLAAQTEFVRSTGRDLVLRVAEAQRHLTDKAYADKLRAALEGAIGGKLRLSFEVAVGAEASLAAQARRERAEQKAKVEAEFLGEPFVREVVARFDAKVRPDSIKRVP